MRVLEGLILIEKIFQKIFEKLFTFQKICDIIESENNKFEREKKIMTRSERLAKEGKVEVYIGSFETAKVIRDCNSMKNLRYIGTDFDTLYNGRSVSADVYENFEGDLFAVIKKSH